MLWASFVMVMSVVGGMSRWIIHHRWGLHDMVLLPFPFHTLFTAHSAPMVLLYQVLVHVVHVPVHVCTTHTCNLHYYKFTYCQYITDGIVKSPVKRKNLENRPQAQ